MKAIKHSRSTGEAVSLQTITKRVFGVDSKYKYKSLFTKLVVAKKRKEKKTYMHINTVKSNKTKKTASKYTCHSVVICGNAIADTSLLC